MGICITREELPTNRLKSGQSKSSMRRNFVGAIVVFGDGEFTTIESGTTVQMLEGDYPECVVCNGNGVVVGDCVREMDTNEQVRGGEIYFILPKTRLHSVFNGADMASMLTMANGAVLTMPKFSFRKEDDQLLTSHCYYDDAVDNTKVLLLDRSFSSATSSSKLIQRPLKWCSKLSPILEIEGNNLIP